MRVIIVIIVMFGFYFGLLSLEKKIDTYELKKQEKAIKIKEKSNQE